MEDTAGQDAAGQDAAGPDAAGPDVAGPDVVRRAEVGDARSIAEIHVAGWQAGYRGLLADAHLDALSADDRLDAWAQRLADGADVLVADDGGEVLGFVTLGPARDEDVAAGTGEVQALYVRPGTWGRGLGGQLLDAALRRLAAAGCRGSVLWTLEGNVRARGFYERRGWVADGSAKTEERWGIVLREVRYRHR